MSTWASIYESVTTWMFSFYGEHKVLLSFIGGAITFGVPHAYKFYKFYADRQELKGRVCESLVEHAYINKTFIKNAANVVSEMVVKAKSGFFYGRAGPLVISVLEKAEREFLQSAVKEANEFYDAVSTAESWSLKSLKRGVASAKGTKRNNEMALASLEAVLRGIGIEARLNN